MDESQMKSALTTKTECATFCSLRMNQYMREVQTQVRNQYLSRPDVKKYLTKYPDATKEEKKELLAWIKNGYTPYCNDRYVFDESDHLLDFIRAIRAKKEYCEEQRRILQDSVQ